MARRALALALSVAVGVVLAAVCARSARAADEEVHVLAPTDRSPGERRPLLLYLHGLGGSGADALADPGIRGIAARGRMYLVAPDGNLDRTGRRFWNAGRACCNFDGKAVDDLARLEKIVDDWRARPEIDPARVYVIGYSNGGFMAHRLACWMDDRLAAVVSVGGAGRARDEACDVVSTIGVLEIHGDADPIVRYGGGRVFGSGALDPHPSAQETVRDWAARLGCSPDARPRTSDIDLDPKLPGAETKVERYAGCPHGTAELWTVRGGGHRLASPELWSHVARFLAAHPKTAAKNGVRRRDRPAR